MIFSDKQMGKCYSLPNRSILEGISYIFHGAKHHSSGSYFCSYLKNESTKMLVDDIIWVYLPKQIVT